MPDEKKPFDLDRPTTFRQSTGQASMPGGEDSELYDNEVEAFWFKLRKAWQKYGMQVSLALLLVVAVWTGYRLYKQRQFEAHQRAYLSLSQATSPEACAAAAQEFDLADYQAQAYLKAGDLLLKKPLTNEPATSQLAESSPEDRTAELEQAKTYYEKAIAASPAGPYAADATLGLAAIAESRHDFQQAEKLYKQLAQQSEKTMPVIAHKAQIRLELLDRLMRPVVFGAEPPAPVQVPATAPAATTTP